MKSQLISGDALVTNEYWSITGDAGTGTMMTFGPDPRNKPTAQAVVKEFKAKNIDPEGYTLYTYAALQVWAAAANKAKTLDAKKVAETMRAGTWDTVLGKISFDAKGDITVIDYVMYQWSKDGKYGEMGKKGT
jgi:branched-chain amino acid transport system substrate-binding protein